MNREHYINVKIENTLTPMKTAFQTLRFHEIPLGTLLLFIVIIDQSQCQASFTKCCVFYAISSSQLVKRLRIINNCKQYSVVANIFLKSQMCKRNSSQTYMCLRICLLFGFQMLYITTCVRIYFRANSVNQKLAKKTKEATLSPVNNLI